MSPDSKKLLHRSVLMDEVIAFVPQVSGARLLDVTAGGGGHFFEILSRFAHWSGICLDRDPDALNRLNKKAHEKNITQSRWQHFHQPFSVSSNVSGSFHFILADLGISSFQIDDPERGMSFRSQSKPDFRMNPTEGMAFEQWLKTQSYDDLVFLFEEYAEEPKAKKLAKAFMTISGSDLKTAETLADFIKRELNYGPTSLKHPATKIFQALRMAINHEVGELKQLLKWAPLRLHPGGFFAVITFHSIEDRIVKNTFKSLADTGDFDILTKKPMAPSKAEVEENPRARSAKLRVLKKRS